MSDIPDNPARVAPPGELWSDKPFNENGEWDVCDDDRCPICGSDMMPCRCHEPEEMP